MSKIIEIHPRQALNMAYHKMLSFTNNNSNIINDSCKLYLMGGDIPWDENGFFPKAFAINHNEYFNVISFTPGTYTATMTLHGQTIEASIVASENSVSDFQIISRSGSKKVVRTGNYTFPFQIPAILGSEDDGPAGRAANIDIAVYPDTPPVTAGSDPLVTWKNNRVKANADNEAAWLSTFAAAATNSGIATWFYGRNNINRLFIAGTVGLTGSGADLELDDVNIVQGKTYGISRIELQMPTSFTY